MIKHSLCIVSLCSFVAIPHSALAVTIVGSEFTVGAISQETPNSQLFLEEFPFTTTVIDPGVEFPSADSLFGDFPRPPNSFVIDTSIDAGPNYVDIDFDNAGFGLWAPWHRNEYIFTFDSALGLNLSNATVNQSLSTYSESELLFSTEGNQLFVGASGIPFDPSSFIRIEFDVEQSGEPVIPVAPTSPPLAEDGNGNGDFGGGGKRRPDGSGSVAGRCLAFAFRAYWPETTAPT